MPGRHQAHDMLRIGFDSERLRNPNSGLGKFCEYLGRALLNSGKYQIQFFQKKKTERCFPEPASYGFLYDHHKIMGVPAEADLWHCTHQLSKYLPVNRKIPVLTTIHDLNFLHEGASAFKGKRKLEKVQRLIDRSSALVFISEFTRAEVESHLDVKGLPSRVIYNGPALPLELPPDMPSVRKRPFFFSVGLITAKKNFHVLLPLLKAFPDHEWVIAGDRSDSYAGTLVSEARKLGVADRLVLTGVITEQEKVEFYRRCEAFLFPSLAEGFGLPALEAMHFGKPVFLSKLASLREIGGEAAYYFPDFSPDSVEATVKKGMAEFPSDFAKRKMMEERAALFSWGRAALEYGLMYDSLVR